MNFWSYVQWQAKVFIFDFDISLRLVKFCRLIFIQMGKYKQKIEDINNFGTFLFFGYTLLKLFVLKHLSMPNSEHWKNFRMNHESHEFAWTYIFQNFTKLEFKNYPFVYIRTNSIENKTLNKYSKTKFILY